MDLCEPSRAMLLDDFQAVSRRTLNAGLSRDERLLDAAAGLAEESGEVLAHVRKHVFQKRPLDRDQLGSELGDALWCLAATCSAAGLSLGDVALGNIEKLAARYPEGFPGPDLTPG